MGLVCPETYNPADFLLEIATNDYGPQNPRLTEAIDNGSNRNHCKVDKTLDRDPRPESFNFEHKPSSFFHQFNQLMVRNFLIYKKDSSLIVLRLAVHFVVGFLVGALYFDKGNKGDQIFNVFKYIFVSIYFLMYTSYYSLQTACESIFSFDLEVFAHFNPNVI
jgi:ATP-binding cassette subfamily G (WHITE) protein 1